MIEDILEYFMMSGRKPAVTPLPADTDLSTHDRDKINEQTICRQLVGSLLHLSNTVKPETACSVTSLHELCIVQRVVCGSLASMYHDT